LTATKDDGIVGCEERKISQPILDDLLGWSINGLSMRPKRLR
jgi:hypothetical protein